VPSLHALLTNNFVRGAVSGLGIVNVLAALGELGEIFARRRRLEHFPDESGRLGGGRVG
jgi:hypothetical protein